MVSASCRKDRKVLDEHAKCEAKLITSYVNLNVTGFQNAFEMFKTSDALKMDTDVGKLESLISK